MKMMKPMLRTMDTRSVKPPPKVADAFYLSAAWRGLMTQIIRERGRICEDKQCDGRTHKPGMRVFGHHIDELKDGGAPLDKANVMLRCGASHTRVTAENRGKRMAERY